MQYRINGKPVVHDGRECGIYKSQLRGISMGYAVMDVNLLVQTINGMPRDKAVEAVTVLRDQAAEQAQWQSTPQNIGYPILRQTPEQVPIYEVRGNIENTRRFTDDILKALKGE